MQVERASEKVSSGSETIRKLEKSESEALSQLFPSSSTSRKRPIPTFDPKGECAAASQQRKKKASGNSGRPSNVVVVVMPKLVTNVPRGRHRTQLETLGRKKTLKFTRNMTTQQVSDTIRRGFHTILIQGTSWKYLDCVDNKLSVSNEQSPDGNAIVGRKSALYLVQTTEEVRMYNECNSMLYLARKSPFKSLLICV